MLARWWMLALLATGYLAQVAAGADQRGNPEGFRAMQLAWPELPPQQLARAEGSRAALVLTVAGGRTVKTQLAAGFLCEHGK